MGSSSSAVARLTSLVWETPLYLLYPTMKLEVPLEVTQEDTRRISECSEDDFCLTHLLNIYEDEEDTEDTDSDEESEAGPECEEEEDRIEEFLECECSDPVEEMKPCPD